MKLTRDGLLRLTLTGDALRDVLEWAAKKFAVEWKRSEAILTVTPNENRRVSRITLSATLFSTSQKFPGKIGFDADIQLGQYGTARKLNLRYDDDPIELSENIKKAIARLEQKVR